MKSVKIFLLIFGLMLTGIFITSCANKNSGKTEEVSKQGKEYTSAYICPMHCKGSGSDKEGTCPVCGMDYVKNEKYKSDGHEHDQDDHEGHNH